MATKAYLVIDGRKDGLPSAPGYYHVFPKEPSPFGELELAAARTTVMNADSSLDSALQAMARAGAGGTIVIVCHAFTGGLLLPIAPNGGTIFAIVVNLQIVEIALGAEAEAAGIRNAPHKTEDDKKAVLAAWAKLFNRIQPGSIKGTFTEAEAEKFYAKMVNEFVSKLNFSGPSALRQFLARLRKVRDLKISRLELRACNIGSDAVTMDFIRNFFAVQHLTAPMREAFYHQPMPVDVMWAANKVGVGSSRHVPRGFRLPGSIGQAHVTVREGNDPRLGPGSIDINTSISLLGARGHTMRGFLQNWALQPTGWLKFYQLILTIDETSAFHYRATVAATSAGGGVTPDWTKVRAFVHGWVMEGSSYTSGSFPLAGLWTPDIQDQPFVLPNETNYLRLIAQSPAAKTN